MHQKISNINSNKENNLKNYLFKIIKNFSRIIYKDIKSKLKSGKYLISKVTKIKSFFRNI